MQAASLPTAASGSCPVGVPRLRPDFANGDIGKIAAHLLCYLPEPDERPAAGTLMCTAHELDCRFGLPGTIQRLPGWNAPARAREVGLWGARLASLASHGPRAATDPILLEAAAFNLAVALFDTVVDEMPGSLPPLAAALNPGVLARCIERAESHEIERMPVPDEITVVVRLFGYVLASAGRRYRAHRAVRAELTDLLRVMYESELGISQERAAAKILPVVWIGGLAGAHKGSAASEMFHRLAQFIARWDDAQDLRDDWLRGRYNAYLTFSGGRWSPLRGALVGTSRLVFAHRSVSNIRIDLERSLVDVLAAAEACGRRDAAACFLADLIGRAA